MKLNQLGGKHFIGWVLITVVNTKLVLSDDLRYRMYLLVLVIVLQFITFIFFMVDYDSLSMSQWKKKEEKIKKSLAV